MSKIVVGDYILDTKQQLLFQQQQEVAIEPKAFSLLLYLYHQRERYVSLEELHQQVWTDRVVSDSAVRSCIKKLRTVLDDHDVRQPRYIKSVAKRGYKLVCPVSELDAEPAMETATAADIATTIPTLAPGSPAIVLAKRPAQFIRWLVLSGVALVLLWLLLPWLQTPKTTELSLPSPLASQLSSSQLLSGLPISTPAGEKRGLALSPDGAYLAFLGRSNQSELWQVYLMNRESGDIRLLPIRSQQPKKLLFDGEQSLLVLDEVLGSSAITRLTLIENMQPTKEEKVAGFPLIGHFSPAAESKTWLVNAVDDLQGTVKLYRWYEDSGAFKLLQARSSAIDHIYHSELSPSTQRLASAVFLNASEFRLEVQDVQSKQILYSEKVAGRVDRLAWRDEASIIMLDAEQGLVLVELASNSQRVILGHGDETIKDFVLVGTEQRLLLLRNEYLSEPVFQEFALNHGLAAERIIKVPNGVRRLNYAESEQWYFGLVNQQSHWELIKYHQLSDNRETLFTNDKAIELVDYHAERHALLLHDGQRLIVLDLQQNSIELVSTSQVFFDSHAAFSLDGASVYFGQLIAGEWGVYQFDRASRSRRQLVKGYRALRETSDGFIAASARGELYQLDQQFRQLKSLGHSINTEFISRWYVKGPQLIWSDFDFVSTWLNQLNLDSGQFQQSRFPYQTVWPRFAINQDGSRVLVYGLSSRTTNLIEVDLSADHSSL
ncbi:winged helix-turn-helix domain-containing protein [Alkalimonas mucilaginosa]|uniref:Winged helix-turn-helix domain-containing protein n=1 Tax=Alkalimonas mucilaginosa TaxID=3057676 RepID=A0ABU7JGB4_9GAMM|nr:winged helix-turn-helix domain-containing protein [Alkalimonas sp. MEB004]MEE2024408.1 winged helix-turn-helix domain-containing protein [Alkalimonas sp. MEB004]